METRHWTTRATLSLSIAFAIASQGISLSHAQNPLGSVGSGDTGDTSGGSDCAEDADNCVKQPPGPGGPDCSDHPDTCITDADKTLLSAIKSLRPPCNDTVDEFAAPDSWKKDYVPPSSPGPSPSPAGLIDPNAPPPGADFPDVSGLGCRWTLGWQKWRDFQNEIVKNVRDRVTVEFKKLIQEKKKIDYTTGNFFPADGAYCIPTREPWTYVDGNKRGDLVGGHIHQQHYAFGSSNAKDTNILYAIGSTTEDCGRWCTFSYGGDIEDDHASMQADSSQPKACDLEGSMYRGFYLMRKTFYESSVIDEFMGNDLSTVIPREHIFDQNAAGTQGQNLFPLVTLGDTQPCAVHALEIIKAITQVVDAGKQFYQQVVYPLSKMSPDDLKKSNIDPQGYQKTIQFCSFLAYCTGKVGHVDQATKNSSLEFCQSGVAKGWNKVPAGHTPPEVPAGSLAMCNFTMAQHLLAGYYRNLLTCEMNARAQKEFLENDVAAVLSAAWNNMGGDNMNNDDAISKMPRLVGAAAKYVYSKVDFNDHVVSDWNEADDDLINGTGKCGDTDGQSGFSRGFVDGGQHIDRCWGYNWKHQSNATINSNYAYQELMNQLFTTLERYSDPDIAFNSDGREDLGFERTMEYQDQDTCKYDCSEKQQKVSKPKIAQKILDRISAYDKARGGN